MDNKKEGCLFLTCQHVHEYIGDEDVWSKVYQSDFTIFNSAIFSPEEMVMR